MKIISRAEYDYLWQKTNKNGQWQINNYENTNFQVIQYFPEQLGTGYIKKIVLKGINLTILNYQLYEDLSIVENPVGDDKYWELGFNISGQRSGKKTGESFIHGSGESDYQSWAWNTFCEEPIIKVDLHFDDNGDVCQEIKSYIDELPQEVKNLFLDSNDCDNCFDEINVITPMMKHVLQQIMNCPYQGSILKFYLESKCLELIALKLQQIQECGQVFQQKKQLKGDDIERIYVAKNILISCLKSPPSLRELAKQVSLNDYKLKIGFRQVFGTTVFGYLHFLRMERARELLENKQMSVRQVAEAVGYVNQSHFASAFRKLYGVNPTSFKKIHG